MDILIEKYNKLIKVAIIILIFLSLIYLRFFFQKGILYDDVFLVQKGTSEGIDFQGKSRWGDLKLTVKGDHLKEGNVTVDYQLPNNIQNNYEVEFTEEMPNYKQKVKITDHTGQVIFKGFYTANSGFIFLTDELEEIVFPELHFDIMESPPKNPYDSNYEITPYNIINIATKRNLGIRGKGQPFVFAILLLIITAIDIKYPLFFFQLDTFLNVEDAKPSEFFLAMQRMSWYVMPIISLILLVVAIT